MAALTLLLTPAASATAQTPQTQMPQATPIQASPALTQRAQDLVALLNGGGDVVAMFAPAFLTQVPEAKLRAIAAQLGGGMGKAVSVAAIDPVRPDGAHIRIAYERGVVSMNLAVDPASGQIVGLLITGTAAPEASLDAVVAALKAEPGMTGFTLDKLGDGAPQVLIAENADRPAAIGSAFKLAILSELIRETKAGERHWDDMVTIDGAPLPGGLYTQTPTGTQVSIRELASKMISLSDNSATDILLGFLGREKVEAMLPVIGWHDAARNRPMLSTLDMFKLKGLQGGALGRRWLTLNEAGKRKLLTEAIEPAPLSAIDPALFKDGKPLMLDIEWYASPADLVRTMDWIRRNTESGPGADARKILAINPGVGPEIASRWAYVGYKGGSEPGVISMTLLLQAKDGAWYVLSGNWNNPEAAVDEARFIALISRAADLAVPGNPTN
jgi:beta-lactamase class A